jgi:ferritin-like metal-binding protein YciE
MAKKVEDLEQLLMQELQDLLDAEKQLVRALPKMAKAASDEQLESALREHLEVTRGQVQRLEQVFESMDARPRSRPCRGMKGLVEEGQEMMEEGMEGAILDSALTGAARKVEHYEMMGYESARGLAQQCGRRDAAQLLQQTMQEEMEADRQLAQISKRLLKESSSRMTMGGEGEEGGGRGRRSSRQGASSGRASGSSTRSSGSSARSSRSSARSSNSRAEARPLIDHEEIRRWAEERGGRPACVKGTGGRGDIGMIRIDFPGYTGEESLQPISWDDWFRKFDERGLALLVQDTTARGQKSNFNKLVKRETVMEERPRARAAR